MKIVKQCTEVKRPMNNVSNVVFSDKLGVDERIYNVMDDINLTLKNSFGPNAGYSMVSDKQGNPMATKDGVTIFKQMNYTGEIEELVRRVVLEAAEEVADSSGDGTSTASILTSSLYKRIVTNEQYESVSKGEFKRACLMLTDDFLPSVSKIISSYVRNIHTKEELMSIANISLDGDQSLLKLIDEAYGDDLDRIVSFKGSRDSDKVEVESGFEIKAKLEAAPVTINSTNGTFSEQYCRVLFIDTPIMTDVHKDFVETLLMSALNQQEGLLIVTTGMDRRIEISIERILTTFRSKLPKGSRVCAGVVSTNATTVNKQEIIGDLQAFLGTSSFSISENKKEDVAKLGSYIATAVVKSHQDKTVFQPVSRLNEDIYKARVQSIKYLEDDAKERGNRVDLTAASKRLQRINGLISMIYVSGTTDTIATLRMTKIEDAVRACNSAYKNGYVRGMSTDLAKAVNSYIEMNIKDQDISPVYSNLCNDILDTIVSIIDFLIDDSAVYGLRTYVIIFADHDRLPDLANNGEFKSNMVINPIETDLKVLECAVSVVSTLLLTTQYKLTSATLASHY